MNKDRSHVVLAALAALIALAFLGSSVLGFRPHVSVLAGMPHEADAASPLEGALYLMTYAGAVVVSPILAIAAILAVVLRRRTAKV